MPDSIAAFVQTEGPTELLLLGEDRPALERAAFDHAAADETESALARAGRDTTYRPQPATLWNEYGINNV